MSPLKWVALVLLCQGCAASSLIGYAISPDHPDDGAVETLTLTGLRAPVTVTFDAWGVPHIEAQNLVDLGRANGYVQGRSRFFQMDMMRRLAKGRVSELVGEQPLLSETTVDYDRTMRGWLIEERSRADFSKMSPEQAEVLKAFAEGVNAALRRHLPLEYRLLEVEPMPWEPADSLAVGLLNVWSVSHNWTQECARLLLAMSVGLERAERIYPNEAPRGGFTIPGTPALRALPPAIAPELEGLFPVKGAAPTPAELEPPKEEARVLPGIGLDPLAMGGASNAWVVSGDRTVSGKPMVANDPHLTHLLPSIMLQLHLKAPGLDVIGVTVPGIPYILAGHNGRVAWGITSTVTDVIDLLVEKVDPAQPGQVVTDAATPCPISTRDEKISVRAGSEQKEQIHPMRRTCHGPVFNDIHPRLFPADAPIISIRWRTDGMERSMDVLLAMNRAQTTKQMGEVIADLPATYNTWTVGDVDGHIGSFVSGELPVHDTLLGTFPRPGWLQKYEWTRWAKGEQLPWSMDPPTGILAHANNLMVQPGSEPFVTINVDAAPAYRLERIEFLLKATPKHDLQTFRAIQMDIFSLRAKNVLTRMLEDLGEGAGLSEKALVALDLLKKWNWQARADSPETAIFFATYRAAIQTALRDELTRDAARFFLSQRYSTNVVDQWFEEPLHPVWDDTTTAGPETRFTVVRFALESAVATLSELMGEDDPTRWQWGKLHVMRPMHAFGSRLLLDGTVNLKPHEASGELDSVWKSHFDLGNDKAPYKVVAGPIFRMVADLADLKRDAWWVVDTGTSGWPKSPHYGDQYERWFRGEMIPMWTDLNQVRQATHGTLTLAP